MEKDRPAATVVLVEDSVPYAVLVGLLLEEAVPGGVEVRRHETLRSALRELRERDDVDCVLLDLGLPDAKGLEGIATLRSASALGSSCSFIKFSTEKLVDQRLGLGPVRTPGLGVFQC